MDQQKGWAVPLVLAVGASCYAAVNRAYKGDEDSPLASGRRGHGKRRTEIENPYNRRNTAETVPRSLASLSNDVYRPREITDGPHNAEAATSPHTSNGSSSPRASVSTSSALVTYFDPADESPDTLYSSTRITPGTVTSQGIRGAYTVRLGPLRVVVRPGYEQESDDYRFPLQCYRYRHTDGSLLTLMAEECTEMSWPVGTQEYASRSVEEARNVAEEAKSYFKVKLNVRASDVVTTVMESYVNLHIGPVPVVIASFFLVCGSLALTIQLQAADAQYRDRIPDLFAVVQNARVESMAVRRFSMVARGGTCTYRLHGPTFNFLLSAPTTVQVKLVLINEENLHDHEDAAGNLTVATLSHRASPPWEGRIIVRPQSKWRLVRWLRLHKSVTQQLFSRPITADVYEFPLVPEMASLVLEQDAVKDLAAETAMIESLCTSGALQIGVQSSASRGGSAPQSIQWSTRNSGSPSASSRDSSWATPSSYFPRYESVFWSLPLPDPIFFDVNVCEHAGDNAMTMFLRAKDGGPEALFELEPTLLHCPCAGGEVLLTARHSGDTFGSLDAVNRSSSTVDTSEDLSEKRRGGATSPLALSCADIFIRRSACLFSIPPKPSVFENSIGQSCVLLEGSSSSLVNTHIRLAAVHVSPKVCATHGNVDVCSSVDSFWMIFRWLFSEDLYMTHELCDYERQLVDTGFAR